MSISISHTNVSVLLYNLVFPMKYRRIVFDKSIDNSLVSVWSSISLRYEVHFLEIGSDKNHVHFLIQSVPNKSVRFFGKNDKKYHSSWDVQTSPRNQENTLGRFILVMWLFREYRK